MARRTTTREVSNGICRFCQGEFDKRKMTQHLKYCKQRAVTIAGEDAVPSESKTRLLHILVEGRYNPQYWMHLEIPASEELATLDDFLRSIWLECCGHLSAFNINGTSYESEPEEFIFGEIEGEVAEAESEEVEGEELAGDDIVDVGKLLDELSFEYLDSLPSDWVAEVRKPRSVDDLVAFAKEGLQSLPKEGIPRTPVEIEEYRNRYFQRLLLETLLTMAEDRSLFVPLRKVLKVGQKFSHEYDFGSTTYLNLRVMSEREGVVSDEDDPVNVLARNVPPTILCRVCGQPATKVAAGGYYDVETNAYCSKCAGRSEDFLPVVNSPRVGVCGYVGGRWDGYVEEDDEEDNDEDEDDEQAEEDEL
jgi:hypothetical protein